MSTARRWVYAAKPASWPKLLVPTLLGQVLGIAAAGSVCWSAVLVGTAFTVLDLLFVVFLNDVGDEGVDRIKREMFPDGCSPKTIPDGILDGRSLLTAGVAAGLLAVGVAWAAETWLGRPGLGLAATACLMIFVIYTFPPVRLNYRGGGELLEMFGVGVALPWLHCYLQSGEALPSTLWLLPGFALLCMASAVASGLADEQSDRAGGKTTFVTTFGNARARRAVETLVLAGVGAWALGPRVVPGLLPPWVSFLTLAVVVFHWRRLQECSAAATTNAFGAQKRYKQFLHRAIWHSTTVLSVLLLIARWWLV